MDRASVKLLEGDRAGPASRVTHGAGRVDETCSAGQADQRHALVGDFAGARVSLPQRRIAGTRALACAALLRASSGHNVASGECGTGEHLACICTGEGPRRHGKKSIEGFQALAVRLRWLSRSRKSAHHSTVPAQRPLFPSARHSAIHSVACCAISPLTAPLSL